MYVFYLYLITMISYVIIKRKSKNIKNIVKWNAVIIITLIMLYLYLEYALSRPCVKPLSQPKNINSKVIWSGCENGAWIEFVENKNDTLRFRIYKRDYSYKNEVIAFLWEDNDFIDCEGCKDEINKLKDSLPENITYYDGHEIYMIYYDSLSNQKKCVFEIDINNTPYAGRILQYYEIYKDELYYIRHVQDYAK